MLPKRSAVVIKEFPVDRRRILCEGLRCAYRHGPLHPVHFRPPQLGYFRDGFLDCRGVQRLGQTLAMVLPDIMHVNRRDGLHARIGFGGGFYPPRARPSC